MYVYFLAGAAAVAAAVVDAFNNGAWLGAKSVILSVQCLRALENSI